MGIVDATCLSCGEPFKASGFIPPVCARCNAIDTVELEQRLTYQEALRILHEWGKEYISEGRG